MPESSSATKEQIVHIVSRLFALYMIVWSLIDVTYLPQFLESFYHYFKMQRDVGGYAHMERYYLLESAAMLLRSACLGLAAMVFWRCGPRVSRWFLPVDERPDGSAAQE